MRLPAQHVGTTRSGKSIFTYSTENIAELDGKYLQYSKSDHFDSYALLQYLLSRELLRQEPLPLIVRVWEIDSANHFRMLSRDEVQCEMEQLSLVTIFDILQHGKSLADHVFVD